MGVKLVYAWMFVYYRTYVVTHTFLDRHQFHLAPKMFLANLTLLIIMLTLYYINKLL